MNDYIRRAAGRTPADVPAEAEQAEQPKRTLGNAGAGTGEPFQLRRGTAEIMNRIIRRLAGR